MTTGFFPPRPNRPRRDFVGAEFPFPVAVAYARLHAEMDRQEPVAAAWQLRDAGEALVRFLAALATADCLRARAEPKAAADLAGLLLKPSGLSLGDWHTALGMALRAPAAEARLLTGLGPLFLKPNGRPTALDQLIDGDADSFAAWRNAVFGHGVFKEDRAWYAAETLRWLPRLHALYDAVRPVLDGWELVGLTPGGERIAWRGAGNTPPLARHDHQPWGEPLEMRLEKSATGASLALGPLLSVQECGVCREPAAFFFDRDRYEAKTDRHRTTFLEYFRGHHADRRDWEPTRRLAALVPPAFEWERVAYDAVEVIEGVRVAFRDFAEEYRRPAHLLDAVWAAVDGRPKGYVHVVGPAGVGKTYAVRGMVEEGGGRGVPVLAYHVLPGALADYRTFMAELDAAARERFRFRTPGLQARGEDRAGLAAEFAEWAGTLIQANKLAGLVVALDGLDELPDPAAGSTSVVDFLPPAGELPDGCAVVLASREAVRPYAAEALRRLRAAGGFTAVAADPAAADSREAVRAYLRGRLPERFRDPSSVEAVLERAGGVFLYAYHLCRGLEAGAFDGVAGLPDGADFYPAYLGRLRARVGEALFEGVYLPALLLLAAAYRPVTLGQLQAWGLTGDRLRFALLDLADFLRVHRVRDRSESLSDGPDENRYEVAHEAFVRWVRDDPAMADRWREAHARIARSALARHVGKWDQLDVADDADLYDLRFVLRHAREARIPEADALTSDEGFCDAGFETVNVAHDARRVRIAVGVSEMLLPAFEARAQLPDPDDGTRLHALAALLSNVSRSLTDIGRFSTAAQFQERALAIFRELATRDLARWGPNLGIILLLRTIPLKEYGRFEEALRCADEALDVFGRLPEGEPGQAAKRRAMGLNDRGAILFSLGRYEEAQADFSAAEADWLTMSVDQHKTRLLATSRFNRGNALAALDRYEEALAAYDAAVADYRALEGAGDRSCAPDLADVLARRARLRAHRRGFNRKDFDEAIGILRQLMDRDGRPEAAFELCQVLAEMCTAASDNRQFGLALECADQLIALDRRLRTTDWGERSIFHLAKPLALRALAAWGHGRPAEAVASLAEALTLYVSGRGRLSAATAPGGWRSTWSPAARRARGGVGPQPPAG
jgi:tetratricopeptide (TPR) repeat protein